MSVDMQSKALTKRCNVCSAPDSPIPCERCPIHMLERKEIDTSLRSGRPDAIFLEGKIRLLDEIGRGGMGTVFCAVDEALDRVVAVKFLLPELQGEAELTRRFRKEARATASINHKNVIQIYSAGQYGSSDYFVAEYLDGNTLEELILSTDARGDKLNVGCALKIIDQACVGLGAVHAAGIVHRDVKPGNFMIDGDSGRVVIMDFGIGHRLDASDQTRARLASGGTPAYMAPETSQGSSRGREELGDIYALGVTAFELFTGELPFLGNNWVETIQMHIYDEAPPPSSIRPELPPAMDEVILRCMAKDPERRYQTSDEVRAAFAKIARSQERATKPQIQGLKELVAESGGTPTAARIIVANRDGSFAATVYTGAKLAQPRALVEGTRSSERALDLARRTRADVLIAALHDPNLNGFELAALVSSDPDLAATRLLLTAPAVSSRERSLLEDMGVDEVLITPLDAKSIEASLRRVLS